MSMEEREIVRITQPHSKENKHRPHCNNMDESEMPYAKRKKPDSKDYILHKSAYMTFQRRQN